MKLEDLEKMIEELKADGTIGIGSEVYQAVLNGRRGVGIELKPTYYKCAVDNLKMAEKTNKQMDLFSFIGGENEHIESNNGSTGNNPG